MKSYRKRLTNSSKILFSEFEEERRDALEDRSTMTVNELETLGVSFPQGGGRTYRNTYVIDSLFDEEERDIRKEIKSIGD
jgi:hypothetical protein